MTTNENAPEVTPEAPPAVGGETTGITDLTSSDQLGIESGSDTATPEAPEAPEVTTAPAEPDTPLPGNETSAQPAPQEVNTEPSLPPQPQPQVSQQQVQELEQRRQQQAQMEFEQNLGKNAAGFEKQLTESGYMPEHARAEARRYVQNQMQLAEQDQKAVQLLGYVEGRQEAALHFMQQNDLISKDVVDTYRQLVSTSNPDEMKQSAERMKKDRATEAELTRLRQGQVPAQTFDNSQGSAEASTSDDRLIEAYLNGDRSPAATEAARRKTFGS